MTEAWVMEYATNQDPARNYCLWDYPAPSVAEDKLRSVNFLSKSFTTQGCVWAGMAFVEAIRTAIGPFRTVFGVKWRGGRFEWELYFYDYARQNRQVSISRLQHALDPLIGKSVVVDEGLPYFMFSIDLKFDALGTVQLFDEVHMYIGNPGSLVSSGISYSVRNREATLENFYFFFDAKTQLDEVVKKVTTSAFFEASCISIEEIILSELVDCATICVSNKKNNDCIYYSGINIGQLIWFVNEFDMPAELCRFIVENKDKYDHLMFDVGFDYIVKGGQCEILKAGCYGVF